MFKKKSIDLSPKSEISASNVMSIFFKKYVSFKFELILATYFPKIAIVVLIHSSNRRNIREYIFPVLSFKFFVVVVVAKLRKVGKVRERCFHLFVWPRERSEVIFRCTLRGPVKASLCLGHRIYHIARSPPGCSFSSSSLSGELLHGSQSPAANALYLRGPLVPQSHPAFLPPVFALCSPLCQPRQRALDRIWVSGS